MTLHRVARFADVPENRGLEVRIGETKIVLLQVGEQLRASRVNARTPGRRWPKVRCVTAG